MKQYRPFWKGMERLMLGPKGRGTLSILIFHRVRESRDVLRPNEPTKEEFDELIEFVSKNFATAPLYDSIRSLGMPDPPAHTVAITFDDGYADNVELALPILAKYRVPATFFVASGLIDGGVMWNDKIIEAVRVTKGPVLDLEDMQLGTFPLMTTTDRRHAIRDLISMLKYRSFPERSKLAQDIAERSGCDEIPSPMMTLEQLRELAGDPISEIGGHTVTHPILSQLSPQNAYDEIAEGKRMLEQWVGHPVRCFAYPNGAPNKDYNDEHVRMVERAGFELAVTTSRGGVRSGTDRFQLPRATPWDRNWLRFGIRMLNTSRKAGQSAAKRLLSQT